MNTALWTSTPARLDLGINVEGMGALGSALKGAAGVAPGAAGHTRNAGSVAWACTSSTPTGGGGGGRGPASTSWLPPEVGGPGSVTLEAPSGPLESAGVPTRSGALKLALSLACPQCSAAGARAASTSQGRRVERGIPWDTGHLKAAEGR
ncbi:MAG: hypothetical protein IPQ09_21780 [Myxococcales bacterium]|nr:hypothetical protein [Myxococcales bacterium]